MIYRFTLHPQLNSPNVLWDNVLLKGVLTASAATSTGPGVNALAQATNNSWICPDATGTLSVVLTVATTCNMAGIAAHNLAGKTIFVEWWNGATWVVSATQLVEDNQAFMLAFDPVASLQWRIRVTGGSFRIGVAMIGQSLVVPGTIQPPHTPLNLCEEVELLGGTQSRSGQFLGQDVAIFGGKAALRFQVQQPQFVLSEFEAFRQWFNRGNAFFIACSAKAWPLDIGYCWRSGAEIVPPFRDAVFMDLGMEVSVYRG